MKAIAIIDGEEIECHKVEIQDSEIHGHVIIVEIIDEKKKTKIRTDSTIREIKVIND